MKRYYLFLILFLTLVLTGCYNKGNDDLKKALLNNSNYSYTIELTNNNDTHNSNTYSYMFDNHFVNEINESDEDLIYNNLKDYIICRPVNSPAYKITSTESDYNLYRKNFLVVDLSALNANALAYNGYNYSKLIIREYAIGTSTDRRTVESGTIKVYYNDYRTD